MGGHGKKGMEELDRNEVGQVNFETMLKNMLILKIIYYSRHTLL